MDGSSDWRFKTHLANLPIYYEYQADGIDDTDAIKGTYLDYVNHMASLDMLVIDDFGLMDLDLDKCRDFFEVIDSRDNLKSTVIVSQLPVKSWYDLFADNTYADACLDRIIHKAYRLELNGKNMRNPS